MLEQPGDHARSEWNDQGFVVGETTVDGSTPANCVRLLQPCAWLWQPDHLRYMAMQISIGFSFLFFSLLFRSSIV